MTELRKFDAILFDIDDTLFNSTLMSQTARMNAIRALREAGLEIDRKKAFNHLLEIVKKYGSNYPNHFDRLIEELGFEVHPKLIAAAVVAYHKTKTTLLRPFPDVVLTLLTLMKNYRIGIISDGIKKKQWEKLIYLGFQHFFEIVVINEKPELWKPSDSGFKRAMKKLALKDPTRIMYIGNKIETDILGANQMKMVSVLFDPEQKINIDKLQNSHKPNYAIKRISKIIDFI